MAEASMSLPSSPEIRIFPDDAAMSAAAADAVATRLGAEPETVFLLPTGVTPLGMYQRLVEMHAGGGLTFAGATFFNLDEYLGLPTDHPASYHVYMRNNFYGLVDADPGRLHVPEGNAPDPATECKRYEAMIAGAGGVDLCVLGIGRNGHIGFNEPGAPFDSRTRIVKLAETTRLVNAGDFEGARAPERAITVGMRTIFESREVLLLASGANKADAVAAAVGGEVSEAVPASMLQAHPRATFLVDQEAASAAGDVP